MIPNLLFKTVMDAYASGKTYKVMLVSNAYTPNKDSDDFINDASAAQISSAGYTAGGETLVNPAWTVDNANDRVDFTADTVSLTGITAASVRHAVVFLDTGTPATSAIIKVITLASDQAANNANITLDFAAGSIRFNNA